MNEVTVAVTGAAGQIAYQLIFSLLKGEVYGPKTKIHLRLVDISKAIGSLRGVAMEIEDCAFPLLSSTSIHSDSELDNAFQSIDFAFLVGASPRGKGMERSDLLQKNAHIFKQQGEALNQYAKEDVKVLVVGNPCNTNCYIAMHYAPNIPSSNFFAMTMLDENRARYQIAKKAGIDIDTLDEVFIYGNHSATQYPDYENARANGKSPAFDQAWAEETFIPMIQKRGAEVISARGASSAASAAYAAIKTARLIVSQSSKPFSVAKISRGEYDSPEGLIVSMPYYFEQGECLAAKGYQHSTQAKQHMMYSYQELINEANQVKQLGFIDD